jgi:ribonuclease-3
MNEGRGRETILADLFEALIGAIYLDGGITEVKRLFWMHFEKEIPSDP